MSNFPLYLTLKQNLSAKDLNQRQKMKLVKKIKQLDTTAHELIYALIKAFHLDNEKGETFSVPYEGKLTKGRIDFDLLCLPIPLRQILYKFIHLHVKRLREEKAMKVSKVSKNEKRENKIYLEFIPEINKNSKTD